MVMCTCLLLIGTNTIAGAEDSEVSVKDPSGNANQPKIKDNGDGTYTIEYSPEDVGECINTPC